MKRIRVEICIPETDMKFLRRQLTKEAWPKIEEFLQYICEEQIRMMKEEPFELAAMEARRSK